MTCPACANPTCPGRVSLLLRRRGPAFARKVPLAKPATKPRRP